MSLIAVGVSHRSAPLPRLERAALGAAVILSSVVLLSVSRHWTKKPPQPRFNIDRSDGPGKESPKSS